MELEYLQDLFLQYEKSKTVCITGNIAQRKKLIESIPEYDIVITSYDYIRRDYELYKDYQFYYFILDEAQYNKNQSTKNAQTVFNFFENFLISSCQL